ncbi:Aldo/keto reductase [Halogranum gelatinilyticum]|uniref:Aldo/keto reductase n=1 Tax=Halogranum gelatinilyticum TaxID=660521 RepID=A0A1G9U8H4_9EURY|nr:aldo/keto reductase [Halogranum gelatinilyticum]SDM56103.1 Aldo/keto reductase [Halogranum gelatinilyticum]
MEQMPRLGLGTYQNTDREQCIESVRTAIEMGYRNIDTAQMYDNEAYVGEGIARALDEMDGDREDLFVATKLDTDNTGYDDVVETTKESLDRLGLDSVDLMYVHWPLDAYDAEETLPALDEVVDEGLVDHIGLSNFRPDQLDEAREILDAPLFAHQVEMHPLLPQEELVSYAQEHDHTLVAYSPVARGEVADNETIADIADAHDASPYQVSLAWLLSKDNVAAIPKATSEAHIRDNFEALALELSDEDLAAIDAIDDRNRLVDFDEAPWNQV